MSELTTTRSTAFTRARAELELEEIIELTSAITRELFERPYRSMEAMAERARLVALRQQARERLLEAVEWLAEDEAEHEDANKVVPA